MSRRALISGAPLTAAKLPAMTILPSVWIGAMLRMPSSTPVPPAKLILSINAVRVEPDDVSLSARR